MSERKCCRSVQTRLGEGHNSTMLENRKWQEKEMKETGRKCSRKTALEEKVN